MGYGDSASGSDRYSVHKLRTWSFAEAHAAIGSMSAKGATIGAVGTRAAADFDRSGAYWEGDGGQAARNLSRMHADDLSRSVQVMNAVTEHASSAITEIESEVSVLRAKMAEAEESEYDFRISDEGRVYSIKSVAEWTEIWGLRTIYKLREMTAKQNSLTEDIQNARSEIVRVDQEKSDSVRSAMEDLSEAVKEGVVPTPKDPALQEILRKYQASASSRGTTLWPDSGLADTLKSLGVSFGDPKLVTKEEADMLDAMVRKTLLNKVTPGDGDEGGILEFNDIKQQAEDAAKARFPGTTDDGTGDAFRHAYWNALMTQKYGAEWTEKYTTAHEGLGGQPANREAMDLYNKEIGRNVAQAHPDATPEELAGLIEAEVRKGSTVAIGGDGTIAWTDTVRGKPRIGTTGVPGAAP